MFLLNHEQASFLIVSLSFFLSFVPFPLPLQRHFSQSVMPSLLSSTTHGGCRRWPPVVNSTTTLLIHCLHPSFLLLGTTRVVHQVEIFFFMHIQINLLQKGRFIFDPLIRSFSCFNNFSDSRVVTSKHPHKFFALISPSK